MFDQQRNAAESARLGYESAVRRATIRRFINTFLHRCNELVPAGALLNQLQLQDLRDLGLQEVPLHRIVGSTGRYRDFDLEFLPRHRATETRWTNIATAYLRGVKLPPVLLYKLGSVYFVEDGNHRISVARHAGRQFICAHVVEIDSPSLIPDLSCTLLGFRIPSDSYH